MSRTVTPSVMLAWVIAALMLSASCSKEQGAVVEPAVPVAASPDADQADLSADAPADLDKEELIPSDTPGDPLADPSGMLIDVPSSAGDAPTPFDVPPGMFSEMDEPAGESHREPSRTPDVHFVPTPQEVVDRMLELAKVSKDDVVYDLGCGDGRIVVTAAKKFGCKAMGVDIDPQRVEESLKNVRENGVEDLVEIKEADIFQLDLTPASVITLYLLPDLNVRLIPQLEKLKPGTRIVSHAFAMNGVTADKIESVEAGSGTSHTVYLWTTPLNKQE